MDVDHLTAKRYRAVSLSRVSRGAGVADGQGGQHLGQHCELRGCQEQLNRDVLS